MNLSEIRYSSEACRAPIADSHVLAKLMWRGWMLSLPLYASPPTGGSFLPQIAVGRNSKPDSRHGC
jgi:hypothetical protein